MNSSVMETEASSDRYREGVMAVFTANERNKEKVLICQRKGKGSTNNTEWQFPQGGLEEGETPREALHREVLEELGNAHLDIVRQSLKPIAYDFPKDLQGKLAKQYKGQQQTWFLCRFHPGQGPELEKASADEFEATQWTTPQQALEGITPWKRHAYQQGLQELGFELS